MNPTAAEATLILIAVAVLCGAVILDWVVWKWIFRKKAGRS